MFGNTGRSRHGEIARVGFQTTCVVVPFEVAGLSHNKKNDATAVVVLRRVHGLVLLVLGFSGEAFAIKMRGAGNRPFELSGSTGRSTH